VSIRSLLTSSQTFDQGVPVEDIATFGNWASTSTFRNYCHRNRMAQIDFRSTVLSGTSQDEFFDAQNTFSLN